MATFDINTTLGTTTGTVAERDFIAGTRIWAGGGTAGFTNTDPIQPNAGITVTGVDCTIVTNTLGTNSTSLNDGGSLDLVNCTIDQGAAGVSGPGTGGSNGMNFRFTDVNHHFSNEAYSYIGNFHNRTTLPVYEWNNFQVEGDVNSTRGESFLNWYSGAVNTNSVFNNVSFWNGQPLSGGNARGGTWQTTSNAIYNNTLVGPFGTALNAPASDTADNRHNIRMFARFANEGNATPTQTNHIGLATNYDFRSLGQITNAVTSSVTNGVLRWFIDIDSGGHILFMNWLPGNPVITGEVTRPFLGFTNVFNSATTFGGQAHVCVGTNPILNTPGVTDQHRITFAQADVERSTGGIFFHDGAWDISTLPTYVTLRHHVNPVGAIVFRDQHYDRSGVTSTESNGGALASVRDQAIADMSNKSYRKYSWIQQPNNTTWGKLVTIEPPQFNATDAEVATARATGYDIFNGTTWETSSDVTDPLDDAIVLSGYATPDLAETALNAANSINQGHEVATIIKASTWNTLRPDAANNRVTLPYNLLNRTLTSLGSLTFDGTATTNTIGQLNSTLTVSTTGIAVDTAVDTITTTGNITIANTAYSALTAADLDSQVQLNATNFTINNDASGLFTATGNIDLGNSNRLTNSAVRGTVINPEVFASLPANTATTNSFDNVNFIDTNTITVNAPTDVYLVFNDCRAGTLNINRGTGTGTVFVANEPAGTVRGAGVSPAPVVFTYNGFAGDVIAAYRSGETVPFTSSFTGSLTVDNSTLYTSANIRINDGEQFTIVHTRRGRLEQTSVHTLVDTTVSVSLIGDLNADTSDLPASVGFVALVDNASTDITWDDTTKRYQITYTNLDSDPDGLTFATNKLLNIGKSTLAYNQLYRWFTTLATNNRDGLTYPIQNITQNEIALFNTSTTSLVGFPQAGVRLQPKAVSGVVQQISIDGAVIQGGGAANGSDMEVPVQGFQSGTTTAAGSWGLTVQNSAPTSTTSLVTSIETGIARADISTRSDVEAARNVILGNL